MRDLVLNALQRKLEEAETSGDSVRIEKIQARIAEREAIPAENEGDPVRVRPPRQVARAEAPKPASKPRSRRKGTKAAKAATPKAAEPAKVAEADDDNASVSTNETEGTV